MCLLCYIITTLYFVRLFDFSEKEKQITGKRCYTVQDLNEYVLDRDRGRIVF